MPKSSKDKTHKERKEFLAANILSDGFEMPTKCYHCVAANKACVVDIRSGRCAECAGHGQSCNLQVTRVEYEKIRKVREKVAKELEEAEEAEDALTQKLLEHRARVRRLRKSLRMKEKAEVVAQDKEVASIAEAKRLEAELSLLASDPLPFELPPNDTFPFDGRLWMSPQAWDELGVSDSGVVALSGNL